VFLTAACSNRFRSEQNHGYEKNWEEAHNEKDHITANHGQPSQPGEKDRSEKDGAQDERTKDRSEEDGAQDGRPEVRTKDRGKKEQRKAEHGAEIDGAEIRGA
jgi:hypothetical protein